MNLADMTTQDLEAHGRRLADRLNNPPVHFCTNADACAVYDADRAALLRDLAAARNEWMTRRNSLV